MFYKPLRLISLSIAIIAFIFISPINGKAKMKTIHQHKPALSTYNLRNYKVIQNKNVTRPMYFYRTNTNRKHAQVISSINGHPHINFRTIHFLPINWISPQSLVVTPNQHYAYVMYNVSAIHGRAMTRVIRYDLRKLNYRNLIPMYRNHSIRKAIKVGPMFKGGHGQSLSYNPKTHQLWFLTNNSGAQNKTSVQQLNQNKLTPKREIKFRFGSNGTPISDNLTFDKHGNAYTFTRTLGSSIPRGSIKLYKGKITNHSVHFDLVQQGIRHAPGVIPQAMTYNPKLNRIYMLSDGSVMSIPANKVGKLKKSDIHNTKFAGHREFEGLAFSKNGKSFLLLNRVGEIMKSNRTF